MNVQQGAPIPGVPARCPMHGQTFAADPDHVYEQMRAHGPAAPVELAPGVDATLVVGHDLAKSVLQSTTHYTRDSTQWVQSGGLPMDSPVVPMMFSRPNCLFTDGAVHLRLRKAVTSSLSQLDMRRLRRDVEQIADYLISQFSGRGRADILGDYAKLLPLLLFNKMFGCSGDIGDRLNRSMAAIFDGEDALRADQELTSCLMELIALKRSEPGEDVTSWLIQQPAGLTDVELKDQLVMLMGAGVEPESNLIANALMLLLSKESSGRGAGMLIEEAIDSVLWNDPPIANYAAHYPRGDVDLGGLRVAAHTPVVISFAAANGDPGLAAERQTLSSEAHLAWGAGPHSCPAKSPALLIATTAIERILNTLPDVALAIPEESLQWRPGPFHRALVSLPVRFSPTSVSRFADPLPEAVPQPHTFTQPAPPVVPQAHPQVKKGFWSTFLDVFRV